MTRAPSANGSFEVKTYLAEFYRAQKIVEHARTLAAAPRLHRIAHRVLVGWRCPACIGFKNGDHTGWIVQ